MVRGTRAADELADQHEESIRLSRQGERLTERLVDELAAGEAPREVLREYLRRLFSLGQRSNRLAREMDLPECVAPLPGPGAEPGQPA